MRRLVGPDDADDVMQETWLKIHRALPRWRPTGSLRAWTFSVARNTARDHWKQEARRPVPAPPRPAASPDPEEWRALLQAVRELPEAQREVFLLREEGDLSFREIADITGAPLNTVLGRMHEAIKTLRSTLAHDLHRS